MLKRIGDWGERAEQLYDEICDAMPAQYREHRLYKENHCPSDWDLYELFERDPVAYEWIQVQQHAMNLACELHGLGSEIRSRATRNGIRLDDQLPTPKPDDAANLKNRRPVEGGRD